MKKQIAALLIAVVFSVSSLGVSAAEPAELTEPAVQTEEQEDVEEKEEVKPEETKEEETKPEETKPEETKEEETKPEEMKPEETKPEETKPEETKPEETKTEKTKTEETKQKETKTEETKAEETKTVKTAKELAEAIQTENTAINLEDDIVLDEELYILKSGVTINGNGHTITAGEGFKVNSAGQINLVKIEANHVTLKQVSLITTEATKHALDIWGAEGIVLEDVVLDHTEAQTGAPLVINGSDVTAKGVLMVKTGENSWYGINVDQKNGEASLTFEGSLEAVTGEKAVIYVENGTPDLVTGSGLSVLAEGDAYALAPEEKVKDMSVCQAGNVYFAQLAEAMESDAPEIKMLKDVTLSGSVILSEDKIKTLDLNGCNIFGKAIMPIIVHGNLTVQDSTAAAAPVVSEGYETVTYSSGSIRSEKNTAVFVEKGGTFTVESGSIRSDGYNGISAEGSVNTDSWNTPIATKVTLNGGYVSAREYGIGVYGNGAVLEVKGGVVAAEDNAAIAGNGTQNTNKNYSGTTIQISGGTMIGHIESSGYIACGVYHPQNGQLDISGGTIYADGGVGVLMRSGQMKMTGGTVISTGTAQGKVGDSTLIQNCYGVQIDTSSNYPESAQSKIEISGGMVKSASGVPALNVQATDVTGKMVVSGGMFSSEILADYCAAGLQSTAKGDLQNGMYTVKKATVTNPVAIVGNIQFETLKEAIKAVQDGAGEPIQLIKDVEESITIPAGVEVVLDLNGKQLKGTMTGNKMSDVITNHGTLTIKDNTGKGTVMGGTDNGTDNSGRSGRALVNDGTCTIEGGTLKRGDEGTFGNYVVLNDNGGTLNITGGAVSNRSKNSSLIRNAGSAESVLNISGGTLENQFITVKNDDYGILNITGGTINNTGNESAIQNWSKAEVTGGTVNGLIWTCVWDDKFPGSVTNIGQNAVVNGEIRADRDTSSGTSVTTVSTVQITGGTMNITGWNVKEGGDVNVSGGSFSSVVPKEHCADGYVPVTTPNANGRYEVKIPSAPVQPGTNSSGSGKGKKHRSDSSSSGSVPTSSQPVTAAATGDSTNLWFPILAALLAVVGIGGVTYTASKKKKGSAR